jgi:hypothetical protein
MPLTTLPSFVTVAPVMGISRQAGKLIPGAGWPARWSYLAEWLVLADFVFVRTEPDEQPPS